jgi:hypothetical protein
MFIRVKTNGAHEYLQLVTSERIEGKVRQRVIGTLGRRDLLEKSGALGGLAASLGKFLRRAAVLAEHRGGRPGHHLQAGPSGHGGMETRKQRSRRCRVRAARLRRLRSGSRTPGRASRR